MDDPSPLRSSTDGEERSAARAADRARAASGRPQPADPPIDPWRPPAAPGPAGAGTGTTADPAAETPSAGAAGREERTGQRLVINSAATFVRLGTTFVIGLYVNARLGSTGFMGLEGYGLYVLLLSSVGLLTIVQVTLRATMVRELAAAYHDPDPAAFPAALSSAAVASGVMFAIILPAFLALTPVVVSIFRVPEPLQGELAPAWIAMGLLTGATLATAPFVNLFEVMGKVPIANGVLFLDRVASLLALLVYVTPWGRTHPFFGYVAVNVALTATFRVGAGVAGLLDCPRARLRPHLVERTRVTTMFRTGSHVIQQEIATNLYDRTNQFLFNIFLGATANGLFGYVALVVGYTKQIATGLCWGIESMAAKFAREERDGTGARIGPLILTMTRVQAGVILPVVAVLGGMGQLLINVWLADRMIEQRHGANFLIANLVVILLLGSPFFVVMQGTLRIMLGAGYVHAYARRLLLAGFCQASLATCTLAVIRSVGTARGWDPLHVESVAMYGVVTGMSVVYLCTSGIYIPLVACRLFRLPVRAMYVEAMGPGLLIGAVTAVGIGTYRWVIDDWTAAKMIAGIAAAGAFAAGAGWQFVLRGHERRAVLDLLTRRRRSDHRRRGG